MRVDIERVRAMKEELEDINRMELQDLQLVENGQPIEIPASSIKDWDHVGLNNTDFIHLRGWEGFGGLETSTN